MDALEKIILILIFICLPMSFFQGCTKYIAVNREVCDYVNVDLTDKGLDNLSLQNKRQIVKLDCICRSEDLKTCKKMLEGL